MKHYRPSYVCNWLTNHVPFEDSSTRKEVDTGISTKGLGTTAAVQAMTATQRPRYSERSPQVLNHRGVGRSAFRALQLCLGRIGTHKQDINK